MVIDLQYLKLNFVFMVLLMSVVAVFAGERFRGDHMPRSIQLTGRKWDDV